MAARIENIVTSGTFSLDGGTWEVDNNVWLVGDDAEVIVIDPAHDPQAIRQAIGKREVMAVLLTHGHDDHIRAAAQFSDEVDAPLFLNPEDQMLWDAVYPERDIDAEIHEGDSFTVAGTTLTALHTRAIRRDPPASTRRIWECCSAATPCSTGDPAPPAAATRASRRSSTRSAPSC